MFSDSIEYLACITFTYYGLYGRNGTHEQNKKEKKEKKKEMNEYFYRLCFAFVQNMNMLRLEWRRWNIKKSYDQVVVCQSVSLEM